MRFAYIDSNGNEVPIPSVDALALRIELGAITDQTQLYDAQADEWGPAQSHEIYNTLLRSKGSDEGFIAPPPVAPPPTAAAPPPAAPPQEAPPPATPAEPEPEPVPEVDEPEDTSFGLTLADPPDPPPEPPPGDDDDDELPLLDLGTDEEDDGGISALELAPEAPAIEDGEAAMDFSQDEGAATFDFGGMEGGLELEESFEPAADGTPLDFGVPDPAPAFGGDGGDGGTLDGIGLETSSEFDPGGFEMDSGDALDLETPMSEFSPEAPPGWMEEDAASGGGDDVLDFSSVGADSDEDVPLRDRRTPKNKPSKPKRRRRSLTGPLVGAVTLVALGVGAYSAWPLIAERLAARAAAEEGVFIPPIAAELEAPMREVSDAAFASIFEQARAEWAAAGPVQAPPADWLAGIYLARASQYAEAQDFWLGMRDYLDLVRSVDLAAYDAAYQAELGRRGTAEADAAAMRERADSGFVAAAEARAAAFDRLGTLVDAAIRLHEFLEANEANIEYAPASTVTTDPIFEVNPASEEIGTAMSGLIDSVTRALGGLGYRDRVTARGLREALLGRVQEAGIQ